MPYTSAAQRRHAHEIAIQLRREYDRRMRQKALDGSVFDSYEQTDRDAWSNDLGAFKGIATAACVSVMFFWLPIAMVLQ